MPHSLAALLRGRSRQAGEPLPALVPPPDTAICKNADRVADAVYSKPIRNHVQRCWHWATVIATRERLRYDPEALYSASLLHDIGLTEAHAPSQDCACFAVSGARSASALLQQWGASAQQAELVADAIARHMDAKVLGTATVEAALLHDAAFLDVVGFGLERTTAEERAAVLGAWPRTTFAAEFSRILQHEAKARPSSRAALSYRLGAPLSIRLNPLERRAR